MSSRTTAAGFALALTVAAAAAACPGALTPSLTAGPFYREGSPERTLLRESPSAGRRLLLTGVVYDDRCRPLAGAWVDFWQADGQGRYDNSGYGFRGHQVTDSQGRYTVDTVVPAEYPGRTPHIHVKLRAPGAPASRTLTTQLFVPGEARNRTDRIFDAALVMAVRESEGGIAAAFDFRIGSR